MSRGGCVIRTDNSQIDARLDSRINTIIANAFGDERSADRAAAAQTEASSEASGPHGATGAPHAGSHDQGSQSTGPTIIGTPMGQL